MADDFLTDDPDQEGFQDDPPSPEWTDYHNRRLRELALQLAVKCDQSGGKADDILVAARKYESYLRGEVRDG